VTANEHLESPGIAAKRTGDEGGVSLLGHDHLPGGTTDNGIAGTRRASRHCGHTDVDGRRRRY
jgi:hypothetical protein